MFFSGGAVLGGWRLLCRESLKMTTLVSRKPYPFCQFHEIKKKSTKSLPPYHSSQGNRQQENHCGVSVYPLTRQLFGQPDSKYSNCK